MAQPALTPVPRKVLARPGPPVLRFAPSFARHRATGKERRARIDSKEGAQRNKEFFEISCLIEKISLKSRSSLLTTQRAERQSREAKFFNKQTTDKCGRLIADAKDFGLLA
ncbi:hypothetical protein CBM2606_A80005 [Cupriavidus taiwanensis]|uniref:hypothetical protein n=1 Tax=Cupriavidus taiwanensis TaxID=164546 RepID=UPI000E17FBEF|nr:hypothetical protein [Cupriavidus taiwanensis]SPA40540.1 hypothetical protein CBM2606_A80005 [Cupriavidus taiwanensis]